MFFSTLFRFSCRQINFIKWQTGGYLSAFLFSSSSLAKFSQFQESRCFKRWLSGWKVWMTKIPFWLLPGRLTLPANWNKFPSHLSSKRKSAFPPHFSELIITESPAWGKSNPLMTDWVPTRISTCLFLIAWNNFSLSVFFWKTVWSAVKTLAFGKIVFNSSEIFSVPKPMFFRRKLLHLGHWLKLDIL